MTSGALKPKQVVDIPTLFSSMYHLGVLLAALAAKQKTSRLLNTELFA